MDFTTFCLALTAVLTILTYLVGFIFASKYRRRSTKASNYVFLALILLALSYLGRVIGMMLFTSMLTPALIAQVSVSITVVQSIAFSVAVGLFIAAAFVDRDTTAGNAPPHEYLPGDRQRASSSSNPYHHESL